MQEAPRFQGIKAIGILFFPFSSPQPFPNKKGKIQTYGNGLLWDFLWNEAAIGRMKIEWEKREKEEDLMLQAIG